MRRTAIPAVFSLPAGLRKPVGVALLLAGVALLGLVGIYYALPYFESRHLEEVVRQAELAVDANGRQTLEGEPTGGSLLVRQVLEALLPEAQVLYPGALIPVRQWAEPGGAGESGAGPDLTVFTLVGAMGEPALMGPASGASRLLIPALDIDAQVEELEVVYLGDSRAYETPDHTVGHIPITTNPGARGNGWYFGHLESLIRGEGNIFARLPRVPELLAKGEDVYVHVQTEGREYLYQVTQTELIHEDELDLYRADDSRITLVTCFPRLKYDQRLLVTAELVGFREAGTSFR